MRMKNDVESRKAIVDNINEKKVVLELVNRTARLVKEHRLEVELKEIRSYYFFWCF